MPLETGKPPLLSLNRVTVMRGEHAALADVTLRMDAGEHICILGPNGCGKSTLIKTITRECYPLANEGSSISILGRERWNIFELRSLLGIVSPDLLASCTTDATGRDVVLSGFFSSTRIFPHHAPNPEILARTDAALHGWGSRISPIVRRADVLRRSQAHADRPRAGARSAGAAVRRAQQCSGHRRASAVTRNDARTCAIGAGYPPGDSSCVGNYSGDRASGAVARRSHRRRRPEG